MSRRCPLGVGERLKLVRHRKNGVDDFSPHPELDNVISNLELLRSKLNQSKNARMDEGNEHLRTGYRGGLRSLQGYDIVIGEFKMTEADEHHLRAAEGWLDLDHAVAAAEELESISPEARAHPNVLLLRCRVCLDVHKPDTTHVIATALTEKLPAEPDGWFYLACACARLNKHEDAEAALKKCFLAAAYKGEEQKWQDRALCHTRSRWILVRERTRLLGYPVRKSHALTEGKTHENVLLEMYLAEDGSGKRLRPLNVLPADIKVEFPEKRLAHFPPGTFFRATTQVCQEHWPQTGKPRRSVCGCVEHLRASDRSHA